MIRNLLIIILVTLACANHSTAQVIVSEDFDYTAGSTLGGANGGTGWGAAWEATSSERTILNDTLRNYRTGKASGSFINLTVADSAENLRYVRPLASAITDDGNTYWLGFTMDIETTGGNVANLILLDTMGTSFKFIIGRVGNGKLAVGAPGNFRSIDNITPNQTNWLVAKISFTGDAVNDTVRLFVNPDPSVVPTNDMADATFSGGIMNTGTINGIMVRAENVTSITAGFDDIYLGNSYNDIIPTTAVDIAKYLPVREKFEYTADAGISGNGAAIDGWGGPWELTNSPDQNIVAQSVDNDNILKSTSGNSLQMLGTPGNTRLTRPLSQTYEDNGLTYWFSFFADFENAGGNDIMNVMLVNSDANTFGSGGPNGQFLAVGKWDAAFEFGLGKFQGGFNKSPDNVVLSEDGAHWFVCTIETTGNSDGDTVRLFLNPDPNVEPQNGMEDVKYVVNTLNDGWQGIGIKNGSGSNNSLIDDIYLALDFEDVVPDDLEIIDNTPTPAFDKFDYAEASVIDDSNDLGMEENGWGGPWTNVAAGQTMVVVDSVANLYNFRTTRPNALQFSRTSNEEVRIERKLATAYPDNGNTYWLGYWLDARADDTSAGVLVMLGDTATFEASGPGGQLVWSGILNGSENLRLFVPSGPSIDTGIKGDTTRWVVLKIETNGTSDADTVRMFVDPTPGTPPTNDQEIGKIGTTALNSGFNGILAKISGGASSLTAILDNLYVGNSFAEITPDDLEIFGIDTPPVVFEKFDYAADSINGLGTTENGWAGPWELTGGPTQFVVEDSIFNDNINAFTTGGALLMDAEVGETRLTRTLAEPYEDNGLTYWLSFFADFDGADGNDIMTVMLINNDNETFSSSGGAGQFTAVGKWDGAFQFGVGSFGPFAKNFTTLTQDGSHWFVARIETNGTAERDTVRLFLNPDPEVEPQVGEEVAKFAATELNDGWQAIGIKNGSGTLKSRVDDIYLGSSFADV
ncbi:MAG: hypothetical protein AAFN93_10945, partial [Bacteroidota bacterium]